MQAKEQFRIETYAPDDLLNAVCNHLGLKNDSALARALGIDPAFVCKIRNRKLPVGASVLLRLHDITGLPVNSLRRLAGLPTVAALVPAEV